MKTATMIREQAQSETTFLSGGTAPANAVYGGGIFLHTPCKGVVSRSAPWLKVGTSMVLPHRSNPASVSLRPSRLPQIQSETWRLLPQSGESFCIDYQVLRTESSGRARMRALCPDGDQSPCLRLLPFQKTITLKADRAGYDIPGYRSNEGTALDALLILSTRYSLHGYRGRWRTFSLSRI